MGIILIEICRKIGRQFNIPPAVPHTLFLFIMGNFTYVGMPDTFKHYDAAGYFIVVLAWILIGSINLLINGGMLRKASDAAGKTLSFNSDTKCPKCNHKFSTSVEVLDNEYQDYYTVVNHVFCPSCGEELYASVEGKKIRLSPLSEDFKRIKR